MSQYDLGKKESRRQAIGAGIGALVGGVIGGYPGMNIGMAIGGWIFKPDDPKRKDYVNPDYKASLRSRIEPVPDVIGTDISPGTVIWLNKDDFGVYDAAQLPEMGSIANEDSWKIFIDTLALHRVGYYAEFAVNFAGRYCYDAIPNGLGGMDEYYMGLIRFNTKPFWFWMLLSDLFEHYESWLYPNFPMTLMDGSDDGWFQSLQLEPVINQDVNAWLMMYFRGFLADFTALSTSPETSNIMSEIKNVAAINPNDFTAGRLFVFPSFTCEVNREHVWFSGESTQGGKTGFPGETLQAGPYGCRDARNNCLYAFTGLGYGGHVPMYTDPNDDLWKRCDNDAHDTSDDYVYNNICKGEEYRVQAPKLQCTDMIDNRVYFFVQRNWMEPQQGRGVYGIDEADHHHAEFSIKFDLFYIDRSDPNQKVTSVLYDYEYNRSANGTEGGIPSISFGSMEVDEDYIYIWGKETQSDIVLSDVRTILAGDNDYNKVYADFSQYDDGFWSPGYAALQQEDYAIWREISNQNFESLTLSKEFAAFPSPGEVVMVQKYPTNEGEWAIVGEGSTSTVVICNPPGSPIWDDGSVPNWTHLHYIGQSWVTGATIQSISGTVVTLSTPLSRDPVPGERIIFTYIPTYMDEDIRNPLMPEYTNFMIEMGFEGVVDLPTRAGYISTNHRSNSHHLALKIDKNTGSIEDTINNERAFHPHIWGPYIQEWTAEITNYTTSTPKEVFIYDYEVQHGTQKSAYSYIWNYNNGIRDELHRRNQYGQTAATHNPMWLFYNAVPVLEWDVDLQEFVDVWYSCLVDFDSHVGYPGSQDAGFYFVKLGDQKFSNKQIVTASALLIPPYTPTRYGLDFSGIGIEIILYRGHEHTGPLTNAMESPGGTPDDNHRVLGKLGINETIYFNVQRSQGLHPVAARDEVWKFVIPTDQKPDGELYCLQKYAIEEDDVKYQYNRIGGGGFTMSTYGYFGKGSGMWIMCDESPPEVINRFWGLYREPSYFPKDLQNSLEYQSAQSIANEIIDDIIYTEKDQFPIRERRFQFSQCYDQPKKMYDVINEVLATCQGFISPCAWSPTKFYKIIIPNPDETPVLYFGKEKLIISSNQLSDTYDYIYADFSAYPDNYWKGDIVNFGEIMEFDYPTPDKDWAAVFEQTSTYIKIDGDLSNYFPDAKEFTLIKDNIKEGSFTFAEKSLMNRPNKVRIEFKNRLLEYIKDVAEVEDTYRLDILGEEERIDFYKMHGIKRATQAARMAQRILDQHNYQKYTCSFETDIMGTTLCMGEIIGVSHEVTGWNGKWFRIVAMEELMDFEVKFELEEFNPYTYHDQGIPVLQGFGHIGFPVPNIPNNVERFEVKEDIEFGRLYFPFKAPTRDATFFIGGKIYRQVGSDWESLAIVNETVSSVRLAQNVGINDTTIYYDASTISGSFPSQGVIWIGQELMYYHGIDTVNNAFTNVVRGWKDTEIVEHLVDEGDVWITLRDDATVYYEIPTDWAGTTQTFKVTSITVHGLVSNLINAPSTSIDIVGYGVLPYFPESIHIPIGEIAEVEYLFEDMGFNDALYSITEITTSLDALVQKLTSVSTELDAILKGENLLTISLDSLLNRLGLTEEISLDALLKELGLTIDTSLDAFLEKIGTESLELDAILYINTVTTELDALLTGTQTSATSLDGLIQKLKSIITSLDAMLVEVETTSVEFDALLKGQKLITAQLDAILWYLSVTTELDALLKAGKTIDTDLDAILIEESEEDGVMMVLNNNML
jgi:hypothetical protein